MIKKDTDRGKGKAPDNGSMQALIEAFNQFKQDVSDRFDAVEENSKSSDKTRLYIAERMLNPDPKHLSEMSINPLRTIRPLADAMTAGSILDDDVQKGKKSLGEVWRESYHTNMRGLTGKLLEMAKELALEQTKGEREGEPYEMSDLGKGV